MYKQGLILAVVLISAVLGDVSHLPIVKQQSPAQTPPVTEVCLGCICEAVSKCDATLKCEGDVCGLFRITWAYWSDAGKPTLKGEAATSQTAYANCANDPYCAAQAVQGYMSKFQQDCNNDGRIDCLDYARIHRYGGYGCQPQLPPDYEGRFSQCLKQTGAL